MTKMLTLGATLLILCIGLSAMAASVTMKISGPGAINDSTIKMGEPVFVDIYWANDKDKRRGFTTGFYIASKDIKKIIHVADSGKGLNKVGDIKGHNGWENTSVWDFAGIWAPEVNWDGTLPDTIGFGGATMKQDYNKHDEMKVLSMEMIIPEEGTIVIDSCFYRPGGFWKFGSGEKPTWGGPYEYKVIK